MFLAARGDHGLHFLDGPPSYRMDDQLPNDESKNCKSMACSPDGRFFAWCNGDAVRLVRWDANGEKWSQVASLPDAKRTVFITFSPLSTHMATWEVYSSGKPNLRIWSTQDGSLIKEMVHRKSEGWKPQWSHDQTLCCIRDVNNEAIFFADQCLTGAPVAKLSASKMVSFSLSPVATKAGHFHVICFIIGHNGGPSFGKLFRYPSFDPEKDVLASRSFFNADTMDVEWSHDSRSALLVSHSEVDKTGTSYYGKTQLHFIDVNGDTALVQLPREGPVYHVSWAPRQPEFCVVYGYMPAKASIFNKKCELVFDFGTGPRNMAMYNPQGSILMLAGFGNLRGHVEMWNVKERREIVRFESPDSTDAKWSPDGQYLMTSTCAPRLRQSNGIKVWHYTSSLMFQQDYKELWEVVWRRPGKEDAEDFDIQTQPIRGGIASQAPTASKEVYRPPLLRLIRGTAPSPRLHDDDAPQPRSDVSKAAAKNKKRKEAAKKNKEAAVTSSSSTSQSATSVASTAQAEVAEATTVNSDTAKKIRKLQDKLSQIDKLKKQVESGKTLELNQLEKLKKEPELVRELEALQVK